MVFKALLVGLLFANPSLADVQNKDLLELGKEVFSDTNLSSPSGVSCATCHAPETGYTHSNSGLHALLFSGVNSAPPPLIRNSQSVAYTAALRDGSSLKGLPIYHGFFWDGRAETLEHQAKGPLFSKHEMNAGSPYKLCLKIVNRPYKSLLNGIISKRQIDCSKDSHLVTDVITSALGEFERSPVVNRFSSKFDSFLKGEGSLTDLELRGFELFKSTGCANCHRLEPERYPLFTDFEYHNIGLPKNEPLEAAYIKAFKKPPNIDKGLGGLTERETDVGRFKTPTLRNVTKKPFAAFDRRYGHNGVFDSVDEMIRFHGKNLRVPIAQKARIDSTKTDALNDIEFSEQDLAAILAFLQVLEDK